MEIASPCVFNPSATTSSIFRALVAGLFCRKPHPQTQHRLWRIQLQSLFLCSFTKSKGVFLFLYSRSSSSPKRMSVPCLTPLILSIQTRLSLMSIIFCLQEHLTPISGSRLLQYVKLKQTPGQFSGLLAKFAN